MLPPDLGVELTLDPQDATSEVIVTAPSIHLTIRVENGKKEPFRVKVPRAAQLKLEYLDPESHQPHLYRQPQEKSSTSSAILWAPRGMRVLIRAAAAFYVTPEDRVYLFIDDERGGQPQR